jgi:hypothetical protein
METFVIHIGTQTEGVEEEDPSELRGLVEHVGSGSRQPFVNTRELLAFLRRDDQRASREVER